MFICFVSVAGVISKLMIQHQKCPTSPQLAASRPTLLRSLFTVGLLCKHFNFDSEDFGERKAAVSSTVYALFSSAVLITKLRLLPFNFLMLSGASIKFVLARWRYLKCQGVLTNFLALWVVKCIHNRWSNRYLCGGLAMCQCSDPAYHRVNAVVQQFSQHWFR